MRGRTLLGLAMLSAVTGCEGCFIDGLQDTRAVVTVSPSPTLDFGQVDVTQRRVQSITITNTGDRNYNELTFRLTPETDPAFKLGTDLPAFVPLGGGVRTVEISVLAVVANTLSGRLIVEGRLAEDSATDPRRQTFEIDLRAVAVNNGLPDVEVTPTMLDFGRVGLNDVARRTITIKNVGIRDLIVEEVVLDAPPDSPFRCPTCESIRTTLAPTDSVTTEVIFAPPGLETYTATLHVRSLDPDELDVPVTITGGGSVVPVACIELLDDVTMLRPQTTVRMDGACSMATVPGTYLKTFEWELTYRSPGSSSTLKSVIPMGGGPTGVELDIECPDPAAMGTTPCSTRMDSVADLAGTYEVTLVVVDNEGIRSAPANVRYRAVPEEALHIQLVWDHPTADLDLHYMRNSGPPFNHVTDCYFSNRFPVWFGVDVMDPRNPRLDVDDTGGFGPENVNVKAPEVGRSRVGVHYWNRKTDGDPAVLATLRIYVRGQLAFEQGQFFTEDQQFWNVADIDWPSDPEALPTINPISDIVPYPRPF